MMLLRCRPSPRPRRRPARPTAGNDHQTAIHSGEKQDPRRTLGDTQAERGLPVEASVMFVDCPAYLNHSGSVRCGLPAEVEGLMFGLAR
jgi:hypothetical protein